MKRVLLILSLLLFSIPALAIDVAVRPTADCANDGDGTAWGCAASAGAVGAKRGMPTTVRGNTYYLAGGSYGSWTFSVVDSGTTYIYLKKATVSAHGPTGGWVDSLATAQALFTDISVNRPYLDVDGVTGTGDSGHGIKIAYTGIYGGITVGSPGTNKHHLRFRHIEIDGTGFTTANDGVYAYLSETEGSTSDWNMVLEYMYIHNQGGLHVHTMSGSYILIQNSYFDVCCQMNNGSHKEMIKDDGEGDYWVIRSNIFKDWRGYSVTGGIVLACPGGQTGSNPAQTHWELYNNLFYWTDDTLSGGNRAIGGVDSCPTGYPNNIKVYNNTFYNISGTGAANVLSDFGDWTGGGNEVKNNLWYNCAGLNAVANETGVTADYNWYGAVPNYSTRQAHDVSGTADPFTDNTTYDLSLNATTTAIDNGTAGLYSYDYVNISRPRGIAWDIGAYEYPGSDVDASPPYRYGGFPSGTFAQGTTQTTVSLDTSDWTPPSYCRHADSPGTAWASMTAFTTSDGSHHSYTKTGLTDGGSYDLYVKCQDSVTPTPNTNPDDYRIAFSVASGGGGASSPASIAGVTLEGAEIY